MILKLQNDSAVRLHFTHFQHENPRRTEVEVFDLGISESSSIGQGVTYCHSTDQFCRAIGRKIALQRAIEHLPREARTQIWKAYFDFVAPKKDRCPHGVWFADYCEECKK